MQFYGMIKTNNVKNVLDKFIFLLKLTIHVKSMNFESVFYDSICSQKTN